MAQEEGQPTLSGITCRKIAQWTSAYLEEHIEDERKGLMAMHLAICARCETYVKQIAAIRNVVALLPKVIEQPFDFHRLRQAFIAQTRRSPSGS